MGQFNLDSFKKEWDSDFILRTILVDHYLFWRGARKNNRDFERLKGFLAKHSVASSKKELEGFLSIYANHGITTTPKLPSNETGFIRPEAYPQILKVILSDYNLERTISPGYSVADFLWDVYGNKSHSEQRMTRNFSILFSEALGFETKIFTTVPDADEDHDYLRISWSDEQRSYAWWIAFLPGGFLKREDPVASGLTTNIVMKLRLISSASNHEQQFWTLSAMDFSDHAISTAREIDENFGLEAKFNLSLTITLIKLITWAEQLNAAKRSSLQLHFAAFFSNQDRPLSASKGIHNIENSYKTKIKK